MRGATIVIKRKNKNKTEGELGDVMWSIGGTAPPLYGQKGERWHRQQEGEGRGGSNTE